MVWNFGKLMNVWELPIVIFANVCGDRPACYASPCSSLGKERNVREFNGETTGTVLFFGGGRQGRFWVGRKVD